MLGDELHRILYYSRPALIVKWAQMFANNYTYCEDNCGPGMTICLNKTNFDDGPHFVSDCGFIRYRFLEREIDAITKSLQRFLNLKAFL